jgi:hypothetical protein
MAPENSLYSATVNNRFYFKKLLEGLKVVNLCLAVYILMHKVVTLNISHTVRQFLAEQ